MSLRSRYILAIVSILAAGTLVTWFATEHLIKSQYLEIENTEIETNTVRATNAFSDRVGKVSQLLPDWANWDDTYRFIVDKNEEYIESNLQPESLTSLHINFIIFLDSNDNIVFTRGINAGDASALDIPQELIDSLRPGSELLSDAPGDNHQGILKTSEGPLMLATAPILPSYKSGKVRGTLVFGEYLTKEDIANIAELTKLDVTADESYINYDASKYSSDRPKITAIDSKNIIGQQLINDIYGQPILLVTVKESRAILNEAQKTLIFYLLVVVSISLAATVAVMVITGKVVRQTKTLEIERAAKKEIEKQVVERTREAQEGQARLRSAMDGLKAGILITFNDKEQVSYNPAFVNIFDLRSIIAGAKKTGVEINLEKIIDSINTKLDFDINNKIDICQNEGKSFEINEAQYGNKTLTIFAAPIIFSLDKIIGTVLLVEDITELKVIERSKDEFFSIASHELRTPLTAIKGNSSIIMDYYKKALKDEQLAEMMNDIHLSSTRLIEIVGDFLDVSRLEQGKINFEIEPIDLLEVIKSVAKDMKTNLSKDVELVVDEKSMKQLARVDADKNKLIQVAYNLIGNSAKFTEKGKIEITARKINEHIEVSVSDTGRGIAPELKKLLFHKFQQANESLLTRDTTKGTGLGLYISKLIIEKMGGKIEIVKTEVGRGTTIAFTLPIAKSRDSSK